MYTITLLCEKGGVGKTTLSNTLAAGLAIRGHRVLMIDADGQAHATRSLGLAPEPGVHDVMVRGAAWKDTLKIINPAIYAPDGQVAEGGLLAILPGNAESMVIPLVIQDYEILRRRLSEVRDAFSICIIDTSPTPSLLNASILLAADGVIFPSEMEYFSLKALESSYANTLSFRQQRESRNLGTIRPLGIVPTMLRGSTVEHDENLKTIRKTYTDLVWPALPQRITWPEAAMQRRSIFAFDPNGKAASEAWSVVNTLTEALR